VSEKRDPGAGDPLPDLVLPVEERDHHLGPIGARYSLVEYGDYENPKCADAHSVVREIVRELEDDVCYAFRNFPDAKEHPHAQIAAEAAEAADMQGKFWLMHDRLFQHHDELDAPRIRRLAQELPIEMDDYDKDLRSGAPTRRIGEDVQSAEDAGVEEAPTFFVNGRLHVGSYEFLPLLKVLQGAR
jgi:protein-disulfide isomerase